MTRVKLGGLLCLLGAVLLLATYGLDIRVSFSERTAGARGTEKVFWVEGAPRVAVQKSNSFADLAEALSPAVVNIQTERKTRSRFGSPEQLFEEFFGQRRSEPKRRHRTESTGSGFTLSEDGYIVTNHHVIDGADRIVVIFTDGKELEAKVIGTDAKTDLALLKVEGSEPLPTAPLGDSDGIRVGDWVMAIGNPFGLDHTVTVGILSAKGRNINSGPYDDFLQTDASINPGNSGGPLIDVYGRVIGINSAINAAGQGIGFAIPINMAKELLPQLREHGAVTRGWLGVQIQRVTPELAETFGLDKPEGALVSQVFRDSPAKGAALKRGDVIVEFNGQPIDAYDDLPRRVAATPPNTKVPIVVIRDGERTELNAVLEEMSEPSVVQASTSSTSSDWGFEVEALTDELRDSLELDDGARGVVITDVEPGSPAYDEGLRRGDVIVEANHHEVHRLNDLVDQLAEGRDRVLLLVKRGDGTLFVVVPRS
ncbi:MAG: DegQ family serine endoprotease [Myxococcota bacterium]